MRGLPITTRSAYTLFDAEVEWGCPIVWVNSVRPKRASAPPACTSSSDGFRFLRICSTPVRPSP